MDREFNRCIENLGKFTCLDSDTVSLLIYYCQALKDEGRFVLEGLQGSPKKLFDMAQLHDVFSIFPDVPKVME
jgi:anti-anti-sigma regulatory factor